MKKGNIIVVAAQPSQNTDASLTAPPLTAPPHQTSTPSTRENAPPTTAGNSQPVGIPSQPQSSPLPVNPWLPLPVKTCLVPVSHRMHSSDE